MVLKAWRSPDCPSARVKLAANTYFDCAACWAEGGLADRQGPLGHSREGAGDGGADAGLGCV
jgi:hypothetical protein